MTGPTVEQAITRVHHEEWARVVAGLARRFGDLDVAAQSRRLARHHRDPQAIDRLRRESQRDAKHQAARIVYDDIPPEPTGPVEDDRLVALYGHIVLLDPSPRPARRLTDPQNQPVPALFAAWADGARQA